METKEKDSPGSAVAMLLATGFGAGYSPVAPGTAGTLVAVPFGYAFLRAFDGQPVQQILALTAVAALAVWSAGIAAERLELKDPGAVVVDEIAGYLVAIAAFPPGWPTLLAGFALFRLFDIAKPPPCRRLEALPGGTGIVADDLMAGVYANVSLTFLHSAGVLSL